MKKILVIGCPGSGKSTFSKKLHEKTNIPLFHLDLFFWNADKTTVDRTIFNQRLFEILELNDWIIDGNFTATMELRIQKCDTIIFLDYPLEVCLNGVKERKGKPRSDIPWIETEEDLEFIEYIKNFNTNRKPQILELLNKYSHKNIYIFKNRIEADLYLKNLNR
jgi:adenylate kinase family enzyme